MEQRQIASLRTFVRPARSDNAGRVFLFHGYGANGLDLAGLADHIDPEGTFEWFFPEAPLSLGASWGGPACAWFPLDVDRINQRMSSDSPGYHASEEDIRNMASLQSTQINDFFKAINVDWSKTFLGGFSQGSMVALDYLLNNQNQCAGLLLISSAYFDKETWPAKMRTLNGQRFFQSHGREDPILPYKSATKLYQELVEAKWRGSLEAFSGGHEIPSEVLEKLKAFLTK